MLAHVIDRIGPQVSRSRSTPPGPAFDPFGLPTLPDIPRIGPWAGVLTALDWAQSLGEARV
jgi:molybdopterin-guanine dinucleotide biosynthesis protein A